VDGLKLKQDGENFKNKLDTKNIFEEWAQKVMFILRIVYLFVVLFVY